MSPLSRAGGEEVVELRAASPSERAWTETTIVAVSFISLHLLQSVPQWCRATSHASSPQAMETARRVDRGAAALIQSEAALRERVTAHRQAVGHRPVDAEVERAARR
jgi:hypothetical protein